MSNEVNQDNQVTKRGPKAKNWIVALMTLIVLGLFGLSQWNRAPDPVYEGKRVSEWFEEALEVRVKDSDYFRSAPAKAFREIEGDAIEFLSQWIDAVPSGADRVYETFFERLPSFLEPLLPKPADSSYYQARNSVSLKLLERIAEEQRLKAEIGSPSTKTPIETVIPKLRALARFNSVEAISVLGAIGPGAAPAVPDLVNIIQSGKPDSATVAISAIELIGPAASNAVPILIEVAQDNSRQNIYDQQAALASLGGIGEAAQPAIPLLVLILPDKNSSFKDPRLQLLTLPALRSLAEIGTTPNEIVPHLENLAKSEDELFGSLATVALWNRDPGNLEYQQRISEFLQGNRKNWLLSTLGRRGTSSIPFTNELRLIANDTNLNAETRHRAKSVIVAAGLPLP